jgi:hypothetical protein
VAFYVDFSILGRHLLPPFATGNMNIQEYEAYSEAMDEIKRLKAQHEEMLLKHAREQGVALSTLEEALKEIQRQKQLLTRAADALTLLNKPANSPAISGLIIELRKAAQ